MFFKLTNVFVSCQALINNILKKILDISVIIYFDDIFIFLKTEKKHIRYVKKILTALAEKNLRVNLKKCEWHKKKSSFLDSKLKNTEFEYY